MPTRRRKAVLTWGGDVVPGTKPDPETHRYPVKTYVRLDVPVEVRGSSVAWTIRYEIAVADGRPVVTRVEVMSDAKKPTQVPSRVISEIAPMRHLEEHLKPIIAYMRERYGDDAIVGPEGTLRRHGIDASTLDAVSGRGGRDGYPDEYYARWAESYVAACREAPSRPIAWLVEQLEAQGKPYDDRYIRDMVRKARDRGLLTESKTGPRGTGGVLTPKAEKLLDRKEKR